MTSWRILDFTDAKVNLSTERGKLSVESQETDTKRTIPWEEINIMLCGLKTNFRGGVLHQAVKFDVVVLFTNWQSIPQGGVYPLQSSHNRVAARQIAQANLSEPRRKNAWMQIIKAKVNGQANNLKRLGDLEGNKRLETIAKSVKSGDIENAEGQAAAYYWKRIFFAMEKQDANEVFRRDFEHDDIKNSILNYGYTILRGHAIRAVSSAGLSPTLGLFHHNRSNFFCLADDIMEPFRPVIDMEIKKIDLQDGMSSDVKRQIVEACNQKFLENGLTIPSVLTDFAQLLGKYFEGEVDSLVVPCWRL